MHGGNVSASSEGEGKGASFVVEVPVRALRPSEVMHAPASERSAPNFGDLRSDAAYPSLSGVRVLIVDDQSDARTLVKAVLGRCGAEVSAAASVAEAVACLEGHEVHIIVSDIAMPDADGFELLRHIRQIRKLTVPVVAMTAFGHPADEEKIRLAGFSGYLKRPVEPIDLARELHRLLQPSR